MELAEQKKRQEATYSVSRGAAEEYHLQQVVTMEESFQRKIEHQEEEYRKLEHDKIEMKHHYEEQIARIAESNDAMETSLRRDFKQARCNARDEAQAAKETGF